VIGDFVALSRLVRDRAQPGWLKLFVALALIYVVSPIDAVPELVAPLVAWLDDVGVLLALRLALSSRLDPYRYPLFEAAPPEVVVPAPRVITVRDVDAVGPGAPTNGY
jgi:uncharacterized membrane protein YkvA (DUF1232 family)